MSTLSQIRALVARALRDPGNEVFSLSDLTDLINNGIVVVSNMAPRQYREDIPGAGDNPIDINSGTADERYEIRRVEIWTAATGVPVAYYLRVPPASSEYQSNSQAGWDYWDGAIQLPKGYADILADDTYALRVWAYAPYTEMDDAADVSDLTVETEFAVREYAILQGYERLHGDRVLFQKWQGQHNNTDVTAASLINTVQAYRSSWERLRKQLAGLRERA